MYNVFPIAGKVAKTISMTYTAYQIHRINRTNYKQQSKRKSLYKIIHVMPFLGHDE